MPVVGMLIGGVASVASAVIGAKAAKKAAKRQSAAARDARIQQDKAAKIAQAALLKAEKKARNDLTVAERKSRNDLTVAERKSRNDLTVAERRASGFYDPYAKTGNSALKTIAGLYGLDGGDGPMAAAALEAFKRSPDFLVSQKAGVDAINNADAGSRSLLSGAHFKRLAEFSSENADRNFSSYLGRLYQIAGMGERAAGNQAGIATNAGNGRSSIATNTGGNLSNIAANTGGNLSNIAANTGGNVANAVTGNAANQTNLALQEAEADASGTVGAANQVTGAIDSVGSNLAYFAMRQGSSYGQPSQGFY